MATLAELQAFRSRLQDARYSGVRRVRDSGGEEVEYRSDSELARALSALDAEIAAVQSRPASIRYIQTSKGL
ncbi:hypothetical protein RNZ50_23910 [Paracoccaceae bacterium Fryx2]|nr:hypothetical protein [Paracoccaceae bacterium Fryx2]